METHSLVNLDLKINLEFWKGINKNERVFLAKQIMSQLGYAGGNSYLHELELEEGIDKVTLRKKDYAPFFDKLTKLNLLGSRTGSAIFLYESGVWKLIVQSRKQIGIKTRNWLAREVLPSIKAKGYYDISESENNPLSYLYDFTETNKQIERSKSVARKVKDNSLNYSVTYNQIHKMVVGMDAKDIKKFFKGKGSARELLRKYIPEAASTEAVIDELFTKHDKTMEEIKASGANKTFPPAFKSLYSLGVKPLM